MYYRLYLSIPYSMKSCVPCARNVPCVSASVCGETLISWRWAFWGHLLANVWKTLQIPPQNTTRITCIYFH